jgi:hypothetical protein
MICLGDKVKDSITGFQGIVVAITNWINGCTRCGVQSQNLDEKGLPSEAQWFDEPQLCVIVEQEVKIGNKKGGPTPPPKLNPVCPKGNNYG